MATRKRNTSQTAATGKLDQATIRIRMYRVGFGDCFLMSLPMGGGHRHILVDCGVHGRGDLDTIGDAVDNIAALTDKKLACVIATHAHQDHISGFGKCADVFSGFEVGEVWLPWTEDPKDTQAIKLQRKQLALASLLQFHFAATAAAGQTAARAAAIEAVANLVGNQKALQLLRSGFGVNAQVGYLEAGDVLNNAADIPGLTVRVLGPPRDQQFLAKMDPPAGQRYLRMGTNGVQPENALLPFTAKWVVKKDAPELAHLRLSEPEEKKLQAELSDASLESLAFALDQAKNNTSLVTLFVFRGQYLLFPGDAQYGNWRWWLDHEEAEEILSRVTFLKVAHHGSHNATPRDALEKMTGTFAAMVSTQNQPWDSIPRKPLMERLEELTAHRVIRSDSLRLPGHSKAPAGPVVSELPAGFEQGALWYDYVIRL
jgi:beta-lactamase superfamily II metal-dependent hydrolase